MGYSTLYSCVTYSYNHHTLSVTHTRTSSIYSTQTLTQTDQPSISHTYTDSNTVISHTPTERLTGTHPQTRLVYNHTFNLVSPLSFMNSINLCVWVCEYMCMCMVNICLFFFVSICGCGFFVGVSLCGSGVCMSFYL